MHKNKNSVERSDLISYSNWVCKGYESFNEPIEAKNEELGKTSLDSTMIDGRFIPKSYKTRFTLDLVSGNLQLSNVLGHRDDIFLI